MQDTPLWVFLAIQLLGLFLFFVHVDDHRAAVILAESFFVARDVNDLAMLVEEDRPNVEKSLRNAGGDKHSLSVDRISVIEPNILRENASDGERVIIEVDASVLGALGEVELEGLTREFAWLLEGVMVWEIKAIVVDGDLVVLLNKEGIGADLHAHVWLRIEAHFSKFSKGLRGNSDSNLRFCFDKADDRVGELALTQSDDFTDVEGVNAIHRLLDVG